MTNQTGSKQMDDERVFDLEERTTRFSASILEFARTIPRDVITLPLTSQLVRAASSIGANYCEADDAPSKKDFRYRIAVCKKEARETKYWLRLVARAVDSLKEPARVLWAE